MKTTGPEPTHSPPIKAGDLLYAVGPGHHAPHSATDLQVYSAVVMDVRPEGSSPELLGSAVHIIELGSDRPVLGFPQWCYRSLDVGIHVHRSKTAALLAFAEQALRRRDAAELRRLRADDELQWANDQWPLAVAAECTKGTP